MFAETLPWNTLGSFAAIVSTSSGTWGENEIGTMQRLHRKFQSVVDELPVVEEVDYQRLRVLCVKLAVYTNRFSNKFG